MPSMTGTFELISSNNYEEYLLAIEVEKMLVEKLVSEPPNIQITKENDEWKITTFTDRDSAEIIFKLGKVFDEITDVFRFCKSVITLEGQNKLVHVQKYEDGQTLTILREFTNTQMKVTFKAPTGLVATRIYQKH